MSDSEYEPEELSESEDDSYVEDNEDEQEMEKDIALMEQAKSRCLQSEASTSVSAAHDSDIDLQSEIIHSKCTAGDCVVPKKCRQYNVECQEQLEAIRRSLQALLEANRAEQSTCIEGMKMYSKDENNQVFVVKTAGMPFFKDRDGIGAPNNADVEWKIKNEELVPYEFFEKRRCWRAADESKLCKAVNNELKNDLKEEEINWNKIANKSMNWEYTIAECKFKWELKFSNVKNRSKWSPMEVRKLLKLVKEYNIENWDAIASDLGTERSPFQCCVRYVAITYTTTGKWSQEETDRLRYLIEKFRTGSKINWAKVAWFFQRRTVRKCKEHYTYAMEGHKKGTFDYHEDVVILRKAPGLLYNFKKVAEFLPGRTMGQVKSRFDYIFAASAPFTQEQDELLAKLVREHLSQWNIISQFFPNYTILQCRARWKVLSAFKPESQHYGSLKHFMEKCRRFNGGHMGSVRSIRNQVITAIKRRRKRVKESVENPVDTSLPTIQAGIKKIEPIVPLASSPSMLKLVTMMRYTSLFLFGPRLAMEEMSELGIKMKVAMNLLSVPVESLTIEDIYTKGAEDLDNEDVFVLEHLCEHGGSALDSKYDYLMLQQTLVPPNINTLVGMRTYVLSRHFMSQTATELPEPVAPPTGSHRNALFKAKAAFETSMLAVFGIPILMSHLDLSSKINPLVYQLRKKKPKPSTRKKRKKHAKYMNQQKQQRKQAGNVELDEAVCVSDGEENGVEPKNEPELPIDIKDELVLVPEGPSTSDSDRLITIKRKRGRPRKVQEVTVMEFDDSRLEPNSKKRAKMITVIPSASS